MCGNEWWRGTHQPIALLILTATKWFESHVQPFTEHCSKEEAVVLGNGTNSDSVVQESVCELNQSQNNRQLLRRTRSEPRPPSVLLECVQCPWRCCSAGFLPSPSTCWNCCSWHCDGLREFKSPPRFMVMIFKCIVKPSGSTWQSSYHSDNIWKCFPCFLHQHHFFFSISLLIKAKPEIVHSPVSRMAKWIWGKRPKEKTNETDKVK